MKKDIISEITGRKILTYDLDGIRAAEYREACDFAVSHNFLDSVLIEKIGQLEPALDTGRVDERLIVFPGLEQDKEVDEKSRTFMICGRHSSDFVASVVLPENFTGDSPELSKLVVSHKNKILVEKDVVTSTALELVADFEKYRALNQRDSVENSTQEDVDAFGLLLDRHVARLEPTSYRLAVHIYPPLHVVTVRAGDKDSEERQRLEGIKHMIFRAEVSEEREFYYGVLETLENDGLAVPHRRFENKASDKLYHAVVYGKDTDGDRKDIGEAIAEGATNGDSMLLQSILKGNKFAVEELLNAGVNPYTRDDVGRNACDWAVVRQEEVSPHSVAAREIRDLLDYRSLLPFTSRHRDEHPRKAIRLLEEACDNDPSRAKHYPLVREAIDTIYEFTKPPHLTGIDGQGVKYVMGKPTTEDVADALTVIRQFEEDEGLTLGEGRKTSIGHQMRLALLAHEAQEDAKARFDGAKEIHPFDGRKSYAYQHYLELSYGDRIVQSPVEVCVPAVFSSDEGFHSLFAGDFKYDPERVARGFEECSRDAQEYLARCEEPESDLEAAREMARACIKLNGNPAQLEKGVEVELDRGLCRAVSASMSIRNPYEDDGCRLLVRFAEGREGRDAEIPMSLESACLVTRAFAEAKTEGDALDAAEAIPPNMREWLRETYDYQTLTTVATLAKVLPELVETPGDSPERNLADNLKRHNLIGDLHLEAERRMEGLLRLLPSDSPEGESLRRVVGKLAEDSGIKPPEPSDAKPKESKPPSPSPSRAPSRRP